jgi:hypothetical protein
MQIKENWNFKRGDYIEIRRTLSPFTFLLVRNGTIIERFEVPLEPVK